MESYETLLERARYMAAKVVTEAIPGGIDPMVALTSLYCTAFEIGIGFALTDPAAGRELLRSIERLHTTVGGPTTTDAREGAVASMIAEIARDRDRNN